MTRRFNTAGPCKPDQHYMVPVLRRLPEVRRFIDEGSYFVLHAPRQVGKTTSLRVLAAELTREGRYAAAIVSAQVGATAPSDPGAAEDAILAAFRIMAESQLPKELCPPPWPAAPPRARLLSALSAWAEVCPRPLVVFIDEIDALQDDALLAVLGQLRSGYEMRPTHFPAALALIGLRDVRDYKVASSGGDRLGTSSPFNIKAESITLRNFTPDEVAELYEQHTFETGQAFLPEATDRAFYLTQGQPWLVNALARQLVEVIAPNAARAITAADVDTAKEILIQRNDTHLDSLAERLREPRVRRIIEPILSGDALGDVPADDLRFIQDLGLARMAPNGGVEIANPIYHEVIPRCLAGTPQASLPSLSPTWLKPDGRLDADKLLDAFLSFWRQHGEPLLGSAPYHEIAPHLVLMAFLHRVANGGGSLEREYAIGRGRIDLCLRRGPDTLAVELKVWREGGRDPLPDGLLQLDGYLSGLGLSTGWLVIFDRRAGLPPISDRTSTTRSATPSGRTVTVIRG